MTAPVGRNRGQLDISDGDIGRRIAAIVQPVPASFRASIDIAVKLGSRLEHNRRHRCIGLNGCDGEGIDAAPVVLPTFDRTPELAVPGHKPVEVDTRVAVAVDAAICLIDRRRRLLNRRRPGTTRYSWGDRLFPHRRSVRPVMGRLRC